MTTAENTVDPLAQYASWFRCRWEFDWRWFAHLVPYPIRTVAEVGVGPADISCLQWFTAAGPQPNCARILAVEPNPEFWPQVEQRPDAHNVSLIKAAVGAEPGRARLHLRGGSSALEGTFMQPDTPAIEVEVMPWKHLDDGQIDVLNLDCEGCEHHVLENLISKPWIIGIEAWPHDPHRRSNLEWLVTHGYRLRASTGPEGETQIWSL